MRRGEEIFSLLREIYAALNEKFSNMSSNPSTGDASGISSVAFGKDTVASGNYTTAEGYKSTASGYYSHAEGRETSAVGSAAHAEGEKTVALGSNSHAEGSGEIIYITCANTEANATTYTVTDTNDDYEIAVGDVIGYRGIFAEVLSISESESTDRFGRHYIDIVLSKTINPDFAITSYNSPYVCVGVASGTNSHCEGKSTNAIGYASHAEGYETEAKNDCEHAEGLLNKSNKNSDTYGDAGNTQHSIGIGDYDQYGNKIRKNAFEVMQNGDIYIIGIGGYDGTNPDSASTLQEVLAALDTAASVNVANVVA